MNDGLIVIFTVELSFLDRHRLFDIFSFNFLIFCQLQDTSKYFQIAVISLLIETSVSVSGEAIGLFSNSWLIKQAFYSSQQACSLFDVSENKSDICIL